MANQFPLTMIQTWQITPTKNIKLQVDASSLDGITRQLPEGYYSTFRTFDGGTRVIGLTDHLQRLYEPVRVPEVGEPFLRRQLLALLEPDRPGEARVRLIMNKQGQVYILIEPLKLLPSDVYENGVRVETTELQRETPRLKSTAFIMASDSERKHIAQEGIFEALLVKDGKILEGMTSNFFYIPRGERANLHSLALPARASVREVQVSSSLVTQNAPHSTQHEAILCTAAEHILLGITRQTVIEVALGRGVDVRYEPLGLDQLSMIDEAFITSSSRGIVPVNQIDEGKVGQGRPGPITQQLSMGYHQYILDHAEKILPLGR